MDDRDKEIFERLRALETNRENDQDAIKLLREGKQDRTGTILGIVAILVALLGMLLRTAK